MPPKLQDTKIHKSLISKLYFWWNLVLWCFGGKKYSFQSGFIVVGLMCFGAVHCDINPQL